MIRLSLLADKYLSHNLDEHCLEDTRFSGAFPKKNTHEVCSFKKCTNIKQLGFKTPSGTISTIVQFSILMFIVFLFLFHVFKTNFNILTIPESSIFQRNCFV